MRTDKREAFCTIGHVDGLSPKKVFRAEERKKDGRLMDSQPPFVQPVHWALEPQNHLPSPASFFANLRALPVRRVYIVTALPNVVSWVHDR